MLGVVIGATISIFITVTVARLYRPSLRLSIEEPPCDILYEEGRPARRSRYLRLLLLNEALPWWARFWTIRSSAQQCRAEIFFYELDGIPIGQPMPGRWAGSPQPIPLPIADAQGRVVLQLLDIGKMTSESRIDAYPGNKEELDVAARFDDEQDCYGWNNEAYSHNWRNPKWKLARRDYLVKAVVTSSGGKCKGVYRLSNGDQLRLRPSTDEERAKLL
jgi:hypothetical protein